MESSIAVYEGETRCGTVTRECVEKSGVKEDWRVGWRGLVRGFTSRGGVRGVVIFWGEGWCKVVFR